MVKKKPEDELERKEERQDCPGVLSTQNGGEAIVEGVERDEFVLRGLVKAVFDERVEIKIALEGRDPLEDAVELRLEILFSESFSIHLDEGEFRGAQ